MEIAEPIKELLVHHRKYTTKVVNDYVEKWGWATPSSKGIGNLVRWLGKSSVLSMGVYPGGCRDQPCGYGAPSPQGTVLRHETVQLEGGLREH